MSRAFRNRLLTTMIAAPSALGAVFFFPPDAFFVTVMLLFLAAAWEFLRMAKVLVPSAPLKIFLVLLPIFAGALFWLLRQGIDGRDAGVWIFASFLLLLLLAVTPVLFSQVAMRDGLGALGILCFALPYFALPPLGLYFLQRTDPWLVLVLLFLVWVGDTAAFFFGKRFGRRKLAPMVSPNKTWEGALASFVSAVATAALWSWWRLDEVAVGFLLLSGVTAIWAQLGDLVESLVKRGVGVKDSSNALPGHGGFYDRLDALMFAVPIFALGVWLLGFDSLQP